MYIHRKKILKYFQGLSKEIVPIKGNYTINNK